MDAQFQLVMRSGPTPGTVYPLESELITIGRDPINTITIADGEVSRHHARLTAQGGKFVLEDLGSTNGTFVNGKRLTAPYVLRSGDSVSFGEKIVLIFETMAFDPNATIASSKSASAPPPPQPQQAAPPPQQPAPPPVAGHVPAGPPPAAAPVSPMPKKKNMTPVIIGVGALVLICACAAFLYFAPTSFWCLFPIWGPGVCP